MLKYIPLSILLWTAGQAHAQNMDIDILKRINASGNYSPVVTKISSSAYAFGVGIPIGLTMAGQFSGDLELRNKGLRIAETVVMSSVVTELLKRAARRNRPSYTYPELVKAYAPGNDVKSFPSGHTSLAFSTATSVSLEFKKWYITVPAFVWAGSVGYSRMYLGAHYPSDVLCGAIVGTGTAFATHWLNKKLFPAKQTLKPAPAF
ncbi:undecaprenyl-diphosphatase [Filimonas lacunae]|uniref:Undecaprenyl-diphosphatase n=1 Tax=Filimonas lacunae TaxID=477680 RepID=A0A173MPR8_9BACT|nr:phosphatase PAP2 family protein [Filimonas lacunae]BAV09348.1 PAP2 family protein [Filimonas lacunae]SIS71502.1 undecaprenyl-diphosphatase [Filimonas lacunae]